MSGHNFDPFLDWNAIDEKMVSDMHEQMVAYQNAKDAFLEDPTAETAAAICKPQFALNDIMNAIYSTIYTVPVMIHIAGPKTPEKDEDGDEQIVQRCKRCGSTLQIWRESFAVLTPEGPMPLSEDNIPWWEENDVVAKAAGAGMYEVESNRELEKHEMLCPDLAGELG